MSGRIRRLVAISAACSALVVTGSVGSVASAAARTRGTTHGSTRGSTTPGSTTAPSCGTRIAKPGGGYWTCTFDDEFSSATDTQWSVVQTAGTGVLVGGACLVASPNNISVAGGYLNLTTRKESAPIKCPVGSSSISTQYTAAEITTLNKFSQAYGRWEIRAKFPNVTVAGLQASLWMLPADMGAKYGAWPTSGEIDIAEMYSFWPRAPIPYIHYANAAPDANVTNSGCKFGNLSQFHTYDLTWTSTSLTISFDGVTCISDAWYPAAPLRHPAPFDVPFFLTLTQGLGVQTNAVTASTPLPATTQVDYVRVWK